MRVENLPAPVQSHLMGYTSDGYNLKTESCADVFLYTHPKKPGLFLKVRNTRLAPQESDLRTEKIAVSWLQGKLNVPNVICFHEECEIQYLVMTQIAGVSGIHQCAMDDIPTLIREFAFGLREIHSVRMDSCPLDWRMERYFTWAEGLIEMGALDSQIPTGKTSTFLSDGLWSLKSGPPKEKLVFTHGDYCLPNILIHDGRLSGIIDWGYAGVGDRYRDFVPAYYTIRRNLGAEWVPLFFEEYGLRELDWDKLRAYQKVHDFIG